jgi:phosphotriesterase-related protein
LRTMETTASRGPRPACSVDSGMVMTVTGPVPAEELGVTLTHEHILSDVGCNGSEPQEASRKALFHKPLSLDILGEVRLLPQCNRDNQMLTDIDRAVAEVELFREYGGTTIVELTLEGIGRDPEGLRMVSRRSGVKIVMGTGFYIGLSHPPRLRDMPAADIADEIEREITDGVGPQRTRPGIIGEIGIDSDFTPQEEKSLRGAAMASRRTRLPLSVHTPGGSNAIHGYRRRALDVIESEGAAVGHTIIDHVQLCPCDLDNQMELASRGAFLGYDGVSCDFNWGARGRGLGDEESAGNIKRLIDAGFLHSILLSHDVHLKIMLTAYGGFGYAHILRRFAGVLKEKGITDSQIETMLVENPKKLFSAAAKSKSGSLNDNQKRQLTTGGPYVAQRAASIQAG